MKNKYIRLAVWITSAVVAILIAATAVSYTRAMMEPSSLPLSMRTVQWIRENNGAWLVNGAERIFYTLTAPKKGGPGLTSLPTLEAAAATTTISASTTVASVDTKPPAYVPARVFGAITPLLENEGLWIAAGRFDADGVPLRVTTFRPEADYPSQLAYAAWVDTSLTRIELYPGLSQPPHANPRGPAQVPSELRAKLLATFNSGFLYNDCQGGFVMNGKTLEPMRAGQGTLIGYADGTVDVISWAGGSTAGEDVVFARQNLPLLVENGQPGSALANASAWGATVGNAVRVWRSAVGVDGRGNLIYLAAPGQTAASLAGAMVQAGAVRAIQLDINAYWPSFNTYSQPGGLGAAKLVPNTNHTPNRYLSADDRDFFAVYLR